MDGRQANASAERLTKPLVRENGRLVESDWHTAMDRTRRPSWRAPASAPTTWTATPAL
ncbi:hypothetical protein GCM10010320_70040 [Streptomyces caelestis]|jgi:formylmethanofuran dehydrogenase subunit B|uniref:Formylmethanofuran dehydrogenase subunit B n=1 Tax=Streptomyces caelestis TaxID=36816 RepID=A0A7W9GYW0_9ACTN|nr:formylmethanofuran dehydrogenase subunit B [Streptomyces caelestis]GGW77913.1 hypothetical protein GCM10010320_70040 [Streptomyces caelestis]